MGKQSDGGQLLTVAVYKINSDMAKEAWSRAVLPQVNADHPGILLNHRI